MALVKFLPESRQFSHDLQERALILVVLIHHAFLLSDFLLQLFLEDSVLVKNLGQLEFILYNNATTDLFMNRLALWAHVILE